ncbi:MAG: radical SAM protein, partial [Planctomycetes bacterium]|nr:radical SAM protein [Planctomycetota bacterium]
MNHIPRLPLEGSINLTHRCNNNCRHCWVRVAPGGGERERELSTEEIKGIVDEARGMGCRKWSISGGEPMLRPDFAELFDYITRKSQSYSINTNGTRITAEIAQLLRRKGSKMVALYGATAKVHDHITRTPGSFEAAMQGFARLKEAGAGFIVQLVPLRDNYQQFDEMVALAEKLSKHWRVGASWLYLSADGEPESNREIARQRLEPAEVVQIDKPDVCYEESISGDGENRTSSGDAATQNGHGCPASKDDRLFASCIATRRDFHIDPYGGMTFCSYIKDPALRYDLRQGSFEECWEEFIPSLADRVRGGREYRENCGSCELRSDCRICPVYGYLEHGRYSAKVQHLCDVARANRKFKEEWKRDHRRYYRCGGITIRVDSDRAITDDTFHPTLRLFEVDGPGEDTISIRHQFGLPDLDGKKLGEEVYRKPPWAIYQQNGSWIYLGISPTEGDSHIHRVVTFNRDHTRARICNDATRTDTFRKGNLHSLTQFPTDQILLARVLADRQGCYLHSAGVKMGGDGLLFAGHSDAGKSTISTLLK